MFGVSTLTHFLVKTIFFPKGMGEILEGWGRYFCIQKWKFRGGRETCMKFPPWWGYWYFLELQISSRLSHVSYTVYFTFVSSGKLICFATWGCKVIQAQYVHVLTVIGKIMYSMTWNRWFQQISIPPLPPRNLLFLTTKIPLPIPSAKIVLARKCVKVKVKTQNT